MLGDALLLDQWIEAPQAVLVGGGTFMSKAPENPDLLALSRALPTAVFTTGADDPKFWGAEIIPTWVEILANAEYIGVRGPRSVEWLVDWGVPEHRVDWVGDAALWFAEGRTPNQAFQGRLAVNVGTTFDRLYGQTDSALLETVVDALRQLTSVGWDISLICAWQPDDGALGYIADRVPIRSTQHWHDDWRRALAEVDSYDLILAEKLHIGVVAACRGVPFVALSYRSKVSDFCRSLSWDRYWLQTDRLNPEDIVERLKDLATDVSRSSLRLQKSAQSVKGRLERAVPRVLKALGAGREY